MFTTLIQNKGNHLSYNDTSKTYLHFTIVENSADLYYTCRIIVTLSLLEMLWRLIQTAAARELTVLNLRNVISLVLATLCWPPLKSWDQKSFSLPTKPLMTTLLIVPFNTNRSFSSQTAGLFEVPRCCKCRMGDGAYSYLPYNHHGSLSGTAQPSRAINAKVEKSLFPQPPQTGVKHWEGLHR